MSDVTLPSGLIKPELKSALYGNKLNLDWDLMDGLFNRVTALEHLHGGAIENYWPMKSGVTWAEAQAIIAQGQAAGGETVVLPVGEIVPKSTLDISQSTRLIGHGPKSILKLLADVTASGSAMQIRVQGPSTPGVFAEDVFLENFSLEHDRATVKRTLGISVSDRAHNVWCKGLNFINMTSDCFITRHFDNKIENCPDGIHFIDCKAKGWWESFWEHRAGSVKNLYIENCVGVTFDAAPDTNTSRPSGFFCNIENPERPGLVENLNLIGNSLKGELLPNNLAFVNSIALAVRENGGSDHRYHRLHIHDNIFDGFDLGSNYINTQKSGGSLFTPGDAYHYVSGNTWRNCGRTGGTICKVNLYGKPTDHVLWADNDIYRRFNSQTPIGPSTQPVSATPPVLATTPANRFYWADGSSQA